MARLFAGPSYCARGTPLGRDRHATCAPDPQANKAAHDCAGDRAGSAGNGLGLGEAPYRARDHPVTSRGAKAAASEQIQRGGKRLSNQPLACGLNQGRVTP